MFGIGYRPLFLYSKYFTLQTSPMRYSYLLLFLVFCAPLQAQRTQNTAFDKEIADLLSFTVSTLTVPQLKNWETAGRRFHLLDARAKEEYQVSHLPNAKHIGYEQFNEAALRGIGKDELIVVYCSVGYRSEKIGERLKAKGYKRVYNLYGSLFEWVNQGHAVEDAQGRPTKRVHTYNKDWSRWLERGIKVY